MVLHLGAEWESPLMEGGPSASLNEVEVGLVSNFESMKFAFWARSLCVSAHNAYCFLSLLCCHVSSYLPSWPARLAFSQAPVDTCPLSSGLSQPQPGPLPHCVRKAGRETGSAHFPCRRSDGEYFLLRVPQVWPGRWVLDTQKN